MEFAMEVELFQSKPSIWHPLDKVSDNSCPLLFVFFFFIRYMQSFVELLDYENRKPEDPHALNE